MPALPAVETPQEAADEDVRDAEESEGEVGSDTPPSIPKHQSTAVIRIDQIEGSGRKRSGRRDSTRPRRRGWWCSTPTSPAASSSATAPR